MMCDSEPPRIMGWCVSSSYQKERKQVWYAGSSSKKAIQYANMVEWGGDGPYDTAIPMSDDEFVVKHEETK